MKNAVRWSRLDVHGPWKLGPGDNGHQSYTVCNEPGGTVGHVTKSGFGILDQSPAAVIQRAPEMLAALQKLRDVEGPGPINEALELLARIEADMVAEEPGEQL